MTDRRKSLRFDKVFPVYLTTTDGMSRGIARNISPQGIFVETREPIPLGGKLKVTFSGEDGTEMTCLCEVRYQVAISYGSKEAHPGGGVSKSATAGHTRGMGLRIVAYETKEDHPHLLVAKERVLH